MGRKKKKYIKKPKQELENPPPPTPEKQKVPEPLTKENFYESDVTEQIENSEDKMSQLDHSETNSLYKELYQFLESKFDKYSVETIVGTLEIIKLDINNVKYQQQ